MTSRSGRGARATVRAVLLAAAAAVVCLASTAMAEDGGDASPAPCPAEIRHASGDAGCQQPREERRKRCDDAAELRVAGPRPGSVEQEESQLGDEPRCREAPRLMPRFLHRVWRFDADADAYDAATNVLNVTVTKVLSLTRSFRTQDDEIVDQDAYVLFTPTTRVYAADGHRLLRERAYDNALDTADSVRVVGKVVRPSAWQEDADGNPVTTIRAKRVYVTD